ncbi:MAG: protein kinase, partial [bacterium]|nr:protein kinase [bacterium]
MKSERWKRMERIFGQALERPPEERATHLEEACAGDDEARREIEALLAADHDAGEFLDSGPFQDGSPRAGEVPGAGTVVGPYRLVRKLGEGGMSTVWLALRSDEELQRRVAIKFVRYGKENRDHLRRLRRERQILASLDHPGIARLHDAGTTADGQPYFVMEYIE